MHVNDATDSFTKFYCLKQEQKGIHFFFFFYTSTNGNICWNWKICNNDKHMLLKHEVIFLNFIIYLLTCVLPAHSPTLLLTVWNMPVVLWRTLTTSRRRDEQTVRIQALVGLNSVCLIHVRAVRPGWDTIKKPPVRVFLTTVSDHHLWLHWNNKKQTNMYFVNSCM